MPTAMNYEQMTLVQLEAAAKSTTYDERRAHLNQAAVFAAQGEQTRGFALSA